MFFGLGLVLGAELVAVVAGTLGALLQAAAPAVVRWSLIGALAIAVVGREFGIWSFRVPENRRLVPEDVTFRGEELGALQFGFEMGTGMRTYSPSALPHLLLAAGLLVLPFFGLLAAAAGVAFSRWAMAMASNGYSNDGEWSDVWAAHRRWLAVLTTCAMLIAAAAALLP